MEQDINQWAANSIADLNDSVTNLSDKEQTETHLATFQVRAHWTECIKGWWYDNIQNEFLAGVI